MGPIGQIGQNLPNFWILGTSYFAQFLSIRQKLFCPIPEYREEAISPNRKKISIGDPERKTLLLEKSWQRWSFFFCCGEGRGRGKGILRAPASL